MNIGCKVISYIITTVYSTVLYFVVLYKVCTFLGAFRGKAPRFCRGGGMGTKYSQLRSEKIMTASVGCVLHMLQLFFFFQRVLSGFNWFQVNSLGKLRKCRKRGCPEKLPGFEKSSDRAENFRVG